MDKDLLSGSFKTHNIFSYFWNADVLECLKSEIKPDLSPQLYINIFQKIFELPLHNLEKSSELAGMKASIKIMLSSLRDEPFDVEKAIKEIDSDGAVNAVRITVCINDRGKRVFRTEFNLGSKESEEVEVASEYIGLFSRFYQRV